MHVSGNVSSPFCSLSCAGGKGEGPRPPLQLQHIHIRIPLHKAEVLIQGVGLGAGRVRGKPQIDRRKLTPREVDNPLQERTPNPLAPIGGQDHDVLDTRFAAGRGLEDTQRGAADDVLLIVLRDKNPRARRCHRTLLLLRVHRYFRIQLLHQSQQILDLGSGQCAKFKVSHSIVKKVYVNHVDPAGPSATSTGSATGPCFLTSFRA